MGGATATASTDSALAPIDTSFIKRTITGVAGGNFLRGLIWGNVAGISQAAGSAFYEQLALATAKKEAISIPALRAGFTSRLTTFWPIIVGHTVVFSVYRGSIENKPHAAKTGLFAMLQPLALVALPSAGYAIAYRTTPPPALRFGVISCALLHVYDRCIHPKGLMTEHMPMARLNRRVW